VSRYGGPLHHGAHSALRNEARRHRGDPWWIWREMALVVYVLGIGLKHAFKWLLVGAAISVAWQLWFITVPLLAVAVGIWLGKGKPPVVDSVRQWWQRGFGRPTESGPDRVRLYEAPGAAWTPPQPTPPPQPAAPTWPPAPPPGVRTVADWNPVARGLGWVAISLVLVAFLGMAVVTALGVDLDEPTTAPTGSSQPPTATTVEREADALFDDGQAKGNLLAAYGLLTPERCEAEYEAASRIGSQPPGVQDRMRSREQPSWMAGCLVGTAAGFEQDLWSQQATTTTAVHTEERGP
jgi:hypothetical protein